MGWEQEGVSILRKGNSTFQSYRSKKSLRNPGEGWSEVADGLEEQLRNLDYLIIKVKQKSHHLLRVCSSLFPSKLF